MYKDHDDDSLQQCCSPLCHDRHFTITRVWKIAWPHFATVVLKSNITQPLDVLRRESERSYVLSVLSAFMTHHRVYN